MPVMMEKRPMPGALPILLWQKWKLCRKKRLQEVPGYGRQTEMLTQKMRTVFIKPKAEEKKKENKETRRLRLKNEEARKLAAEKSERKRKAAENRLSQTW